MATGDASDPRIAQIASSIRVIPDFPKPGTMLHAQLLRGFLAGCRLVAMILSRRAVSWDFLPTFPLYFGVYFLLLNVHALGTMVC